jgi:hypothetical protein
MRTSDEYRKIAEEYVRLASEAKTETDRLALLDLARTWFDTASRQAEMSPERAEARKFTMAQPKKSLGWRQRILRQFRRQRS